MPTESDEWIIAANVDLNETLMKRRKVFNVFQDEAGVNVVSERKRERERGSQAACGKEYFTIHYFLLAKLKVPC